MHPSVKAFAYARRRIWSASSGRRNSHAHEESIAACRLGLLQLRMPALHEQKYFAASANYRNSPPHEGWLRRSGFQVIAMRYKNCPFDCSICKIM